MDMPRLVVGFHGTVLDDAIEMARGNYVDSGNTTRWLGAGIYFFEYNISMAVHWAKIRAMKHNSVPAILRAEIDLQRCLDVTDLTWQTNVQNAHRAIEAEWSADSTIPRPQQKPLEIYKGQVRAGYHGEWKDYGRNELDYQVIERSVRLAKDKEDLTFDTVRGVFPEGGCLYTSSWLLDQAHVAIAVRAPYKSIINPQCIEI